jgi:transposase-like protein
MCAPGPTRCIKMPAKPDLEISPECECSREPAGRHQMAMLGVRADGRKELVAITDGYRESTESWADLLRDCKRRGMTAPVLAVGEGALGFWKAMREVFPATKEQ